MDSGAVSARPLPGRLLPLGGIRNAAGAVVIQCDSKGRGAVPLRRVTAPQPDHASAVIIAVSAVVAVAVVAVIRIPPARAFVPMALIPTAMVPVLAAWAASAFWITEPSTVPVPACSGPFTGPSVRADAPTVPKPRIPVVAARAMSVLRTVCSSFSSAQTVGAGSDRTAARSRRKLGITGMSGHALRTHHRHVARQPNDWAIVLLRTKEKKPCTPSNRLTYRPTCRPARNRTPIRHPRRRSRFHRDPIHARSQVRRCLRRCDVRPGGGIHQAGASPLSIMRYR
jgi:hypothetical protein